MTKVEMVSEVTPADLEAVAESSREVGRKDGEQATFRLVLSFLADTLQATETNYAKSKEGPDGYYGGRRDAVNSLYDSIFYMSQNRESK